MKVVIIEDEHLTADRMRTMLLRIPVTSGPHHPRFGKNFGTVVSTKRKTRPGIDGYPAGRRNVL